MSTTTDVLSLFKYDPVADADSTFNITQALNNNWDKLDAAILLAIAAAGAYNPEESYAVGDYCTYKGKLRKCSTAIPTGEAWTEAHWTTTTVAAEMQELSSQLSNKVGNQALEIPNSDCNDIADFGLYRVQNDTANGYTSTVGDSVINAPWDMNTMFQLFLSASAGKMLWRTKVSALENPWSEWFPLANATPPQEYDLPLVDGISGTAKYSKDQFGIVRVHMAAVKDSGTITNNEILGTLPEGFRPKLSFAVVGYGNSNPNTISDRHTVNMYISSNGDITASFLSETNAAKLASLYGVTEFIAAS